MQNVTVDRFEFSLPSGWIFLKYDDCTFYRKHFNSVANSKALDLLVLAPHGAELWLIEIKDYRLQKRVKPENLFAEIAGKVRDTLAGLATARVYVNDPSVQVFADKAMRAHRLRVAFVLQQPTHQSRLFPQIVDPANGTIKLKKALRAIDRHPFLGNAAELARKTAWIVTPP